MLLITVTYRQLAYPKSLARRTIQQMLFQTADGLTAPALPQPAELAS